MDCHNKHQSPRRSFCHNILEHKRIRSLGLAKTYTKHHYDMGCYGRGCIWLKCLARLVLFIERICEIYFFSICDIITHKYLHLWVLKVYTCTTELVGWTGKKQFFFLRSRSRTFCDPGFDVISLNPF